MKNRSFVPTQVVTRDSTRSLIFTHTKQLTILKTPTMIACGGATCNKVLLSKSFKHLVLVKTQVLCCKGTQVSTRPTKNKRTPTGCKSVKSSSSSNNRTKPLKADFLQRKKLKILRKLKRKKPLLKQTLSMNT